EAAEEAEAAEEGDTFSLAFGGGAPESPAEEPEAPKADDRRVRCPKCGEEMLLSELVDVETGEPLDLASLIPAELVEAPSDDTGYALAGGGFGVSEASGTDGAAVPRKTVIHRSRPKKPRSVLKELIFVVMGGLMAVPIAHYLAIPIQKYIQQREDAYGLFQFPTPGFPDTYKFQKKYPWVPTCLLPGYDAEALKVENLEEEDAPAKETKKAEKPAEETDDAAAEDDWVEGETDDSGEVEADVVNEEASADDDEGGFALAGDFTEPELKEEDDASGDLSAMFGSRPGEEAAPKPAAPQPKEEPSEEPVEEPAAEEPAAESKEESKPEPKAEPKPAEKKGLTENLPEVKPEEVSPLLAGLATDGSAEKLTAANLVAEKLTCLKSDDASLAVREQAVAALRKLAEDKGVVEKLNKAQVARLTAENHAQGIVFVGTVEKVASVKGMTALKVAFDATDKKVYVLSNEVGEVAEGKRYAFTGLVVDPNQDERVVVTSKKAPLVWRGLFVELP
ncbi:MAG: hypothetical protein Q4D98_14070, partial [Planctomycetia bacterium]|nr:hypothetical protein [Planctomycetia bacterium]